mmetsp:Transcript_8214/g.30861  ORF Transcript_8214/g.30861 Transcript_8214/m.30861 type:complete len:310 (-) Transcript_8214:181-1110(-)
MPADGGGALQDLFAPLAQMLLPILHHVLELKVLLDKRGRPLLRAPAEQRPQVHAPGLHHHRRVHCRRGCAEIPQALLPFDGALQVLLVLVLVLVLMLVLLGVGALLGTLLLGHAAAGKDVRQLHFGPAGIGRIVEGVAVHGLVQRSIRVFSLQGLVVAAWDIEAHLASPVVHAGVLGVAGFRPVVLHGQKRRHEHSRDGRAWRFVGRRVVHGFLSERQARLARIFQVLLLLFGEILRAPGEVLVCLLRCHGAVRAAGGARVDLCDLDGVLGLAELKFALVGDWIEFRGSHKRFRSSLHGSSAVLHAEAT